MSQNIVNEYIRNEETDERWLLETELQVFLFFKTKKQRVKLKDQRETMIHDNLQRLGHKAKVSSLTEITEAVDVGAMANMWDLDLFTLQMKDQYSMVHKIFNQLGYFEYFKIADTDFSNFLRALSGAYNKHNNPFHNFQHGVNVCHSCSWLIRETSLGNYIKDKLVAFR
jgi:hypothetical protein